LGDYKAALEAQRKLEETDKKLNQQRLSRATEELEIKYETEKKERQLAEAKQLQNYLLFGAIGLSTDPAQLVSICSATNKKSSRKKRN
jgi:hypothetical protein